jgi:glucose/arabinose dehydrogenase
MTTVWSYPYDAAAGTVGTRKTLITDMSDSGHSTRTLFVSQQNPDILMVAVGSDGNIDAPTSEKGSGRSEFHTFSIQNISQAPVPYNSGEVFAWGLRNSVGIGENPATGGIVSSPSPLGRCKNSSHTTVVVR